MVEEFNTLYASMKKQVEKRTKQLQEELATANAVFQDILNFVQEVQPILSYIHSIDVVEPYIKDEKIQGGKIVLHTNYESDSNATCNNVGTKTADCDFATFHGTEYTCNQSHTVSGDTYGNHQWIAETCTNPTCSVCGAPKIVKATKDGTMTVDYGQILNLNGYNVTVNDPVETLKVINTSFMTNSGLQLDGEHPGSLTTNGTVATAATDGNFWYLAVKEGDTYNFHPFNLAISRLGLNTLGKDGANPAVCIEVMFIANNVAKAKLRAEGNDYGINKLSGENPVFVSAKASYAFGDANGVKAYYDLSNSLTDYIDSEYKLQACIVIDGEEICNKIVTVIPREVLKSINDKIEGGSGTVTVSQETAIKGLMENNTRVNNIFSCYREGDCTHEATSGGKCLDCDE